MKGYEPTTIGKMRKGVEVAKLPRVTPHTK